MTSRRLDASLITGFWPYALGLVPLLYLSFSSGGFFVGETGIAAAATAIALLLCATLVRRPLAGVGVPTIAVALLLTCLAGLMLLSSAWSDSSSRALLEFDRALLYLLLFVLAGVIPAASGEDALRRTVRGVAGGIVAVAISAFITRTLPELWSAPPNLQPGRLSYPLSYWNSLGLLTALGTLLCLHLTCAPREARAVRAAAAGAVPVLVSVTYLTVSRGAIVAGVIGLLAYAILARPRLLPTGGVAAGIPAALALIAAYGADELVSDTPTSAAAVAQGGDLALVVAVCVLAAMVLRIVLGAVEDRLPRMPDGARGLRLRRMGWGALAAVVLVATVGGVASGFAGRQVDRFVDGDKKVERADDLRARLSQVSSNGRIEQWRVARDVWRDAPLLGNGAGTFETEFARRRTTDLKVVHAHSLYMETLADLGLVGLVLVLGAIGTVLGVLARRARGPNRALYAAAFAAGLTWAIATGVDWHWSMPAVTVPFWIIAGAGLRRSRPVAPGSPLSNPIRVLIAVGCAVLAITPALVAVSQGQLNQAVAALRDRNCTEAIDSALASLAAIGSRPQPYEILGFCDVRLGKPALGVRVFEKARKLDPDNWELAYGLALVQAAAGVDPRPAVREARRLNPREGLVKAAVRGLRGEDPARWRAWALKARLPL